MNFDTIESASDIVSNKNNALLFDGVNLLNTSASSMLSFSLESFILECARSSSSSTPKKFSRLALDDINSIQPISKFNQQDTLFTDVGLSRISLYKSMPDIECNKKQEDIVKFLFKYKLNIFKTNFFY